LTGRVTSMGEKRNSYEVLIGEFEGQRTFERLRRIWKNHTETYLKKMESVRVYCVNLKSIIFWDVMLYSLVVYHRGFGGSYRLCLQGRREN
jgi:hypothetical protein